MPEPDPFASPFHRVDLPGQGHAHAPLPPGFQLPAPMPPVHPADLGPRRPVTTTGSSSTAPAEMRNSTWMVSPERNCSGRIPIPIRFERWMRS